MELDVYANDLATPKEYTPVRIESDEYKIIFKCVDLALALLESSQGRESLIQVAHRVVEIKKRTRKPHLYRYKEEDMGAWISTFLRRLRRSFPRVGIAVKLGGEAATVRLPWGGDMEQYNPVDAAMLYLDRALIDNMVHVHRLRDEPSYLIFKFQMVIAIAHEVVHMLVGLLTGETNTGTPPTMTMEGYNASGGESGRYWEAILLGGTVEFWSEKKHKLGNRQAGKPYLFPNCRSDSVGRLIDSSYVNSILARSFSFPVARSRTSQDVTRAALSSQGREETHFLRSARRQRVAVSSEGSGDASSRLAYRRILEESSSSSYGRDPTENSNAAYRRAPVAEASNVAYHRAPPAAGGIVYRQVPVEVAPVAYRRPPADPRGHQYSNMAPGPHSGYGPVAYYPRR
ncbi:hypothetical protein LIA77_01654 [Sarocladium implicatum]|nr:hypothetical protein LIA77_01654 [Sarocladium implicatum]